MPEMEKKYVPYLHALCQLRPVHRWSLLATDPVKKEMPLYWFKTNNMTAMKVRRRYSRLKSLAHEELAASSRSLSMASCIMLTSAWTAELG